MSSEQLHEPAESLRVETMDHHRAVTSLVEEFEAIDWYDQRVDATQDEELKKILAHNRDEEKEHTAMTLEWLRRHDPKMDEVLHTYLFTQGSVVTIESAEAGGGGTGGAPSDGSLGIGSLKR